MLAGTHTHSGPGQFFGNTLYDKFTGPESGLLEERAGWLADRIAEAAGQALDGLVPGGAAVVRPKVWRSSSNRCMSAFVHNPEGAEQAQDWLAEGAPGAGAPDGLCIEDRCVDPRISGLALWDDEGRVLGAHGVFAVHGTCLGSTVDHYNPDWGGPAAEVARRGLAEAGHDAVVGWACGAAGDISPVPQPPGRDDPGPRPSEQGQALADAVGGRLGQALAQAVLEASPAAFSVAASRSVLTVAEADLAAPRFGLAALGGAIDGRNELVYPLVGNGVRTSFYGKKHPQHPKTPAMPGFLMDRWAPRRLPLQVVRVGTHAWATIPGEPTVATAWRLEQALCRLDGIESATVVGYSGEYAGYWVTPEEYDQQLYQGASTLFGRESSARLIEHIVEVAGGVAAV